MKRTRKTILSVRRFFALCFFILFFSALGAQSAAAAPLPLSGFAWSETTGWLSLSGENDTNPSLAGAQKSAVPYGVSIESSGAGLLSGFAWSEHIGWVSFNEADLAGCPGGGGACSARVDGAGHWSGWARACAGTVGGDCRSATRSDGWDGWLSLGGSNYAVAWNAVAKRYEGYAWGSDVVGWVYFTASFAGPVLAVSYQCETNWQVSAIPYHKSNTLNWNAASGAARYDVYRSKTDETNYEKLGSVTGTSFVDGPYTQSTGYLAFDAFYKVIPFTSSGGELPVSNVAFQEGWGDACGGPPPPYPNLTANTPSLTDQCGNSGELLAGTVTLRSSVNNIGTAPTADGVFMNQYQYRLTGAGTWGTLVTLFLSDTSRSVSAGEGDRAVSPHSWPAGEGAWEFRLLADSSATVPETDETDNFSGAASATVVDFTAALAADKSAPLIGDSVRFTPVLSGTALGAVTFSNHSCGGGATPTNIDAATGAFSCVYASAGSPQASVAVKRAPSAALRSASACVSKTAAKTVTVASPPLTPKAQLYISPSGECGTGVRSVVLRNQKAKLCWSVESQ